MADKLSLYIHIPFCVSKCSYCDFCSFVPHNDQITQYLQALNTEILSASQKTKGKSISSIYIGGGTPSTLPNGAISNILNTIYSNFNILTDASVTIEANPNSFGLEKAQEYKQAGCTRISLGLQSHKPSILKVLNRVHSYQDFTQAIDNAIRAGITDINADVMLGVPTQTIQDLSETLQNLVNLPIKHISAYGLICEPNTPLTKLINQNKLILPSEDETVYMYDFAVNFLEEHGFYRYEISNFAKPGYQSQHNLNYWNRGEYLGLGLSAYSFYDNAHWHNTEDFKEYISNPTNSIKDYEIQTEQTAKEETIMLALRTIEGLDINKFNQTFNTDFYKDYKNTLDKLLKNNLIKIVNNHLRIKNLYISNAIIAEFF